MSSAIPYFVMRAARRAREEAENNPQPQQPRKPKVPKSIMTICSFIFFLISLVLATGAAFAGVLPIALFAISLGIGSVVLAILSLRDL